MKLNITERVTLLFYFIGATVGLIYVKPNAFAAWVLLCILATTGILSGTLLILNILSGISHNCTKAKRCKNG